MHFFSYFLEARIPSYGKRRVDGNTLMRSMRYAIDRRRAECDQERLIEGLQHALSKIIDPNEAIPDLRPL